MAFSSATSARGRGRLGSASTSSLSSIGTSPATEGGYYSLAQQPYSHQHMQHHHHHHNHLQQQLVGQYNPPIDPQLFGIAGDTSLPEARFASSSVITGEVVAGGAASGVYSDTERLPSLGISVSGDEEEEAEREGRELAKTVKLEEVENSHHNHDGQQQRFGTAGMDSTGDGAAGIIQPWQRGEEGVGMMTGRRQLRSRSTLELSEPDIGAHSDTDQEQDNQCHQETASASPEPDKESSPPLPLLPPPPTPLSQVPVKRGRGRPRKHPLPVDANNQPILPTPKKTVTIATPAVTAIAQSAPASAAKPTQKETPAETSPTPVKMLPEEGEAAAPVTPVPVKRGPGRPKGSGNKRKAFNLKKRTSSGTPGPRTPTQSVPAGTILPDGVVKRGPGRPRKSMLAAMHNSGNGDRRTSGYSVGTPATDQNYTPGWRRSVRERRSVNNSSLFNRANLAEEDLKAPVMGQGCLRKVRRSVAGRRHGERGGSEGEEVEEAERKAERRGYIGKAELQKIRRAKITAKLQPPINDSEALPVFPPEFGFKVSYFRASSHSQSSPRSATSSSAAEASPTPSSPRSTTANNNSTSLPTPPATQSEDENYEPPRKKARVWMGETDEGYEPITCLYTFAPTAEVFRDFEGFVKAISCVGKRQGCVRVKVPKECIPEPVHEVPVGEDGGEGARVAFEALVHRPPQQLAPEHAPRSSRRVGEDDDEEGGSENEDENRGSRCSSGARYTRSPELEQPMTYAIPATDFLERRDWRDDLATRSPEELLCTEADNETTLITKGLASLEEENELEKITYSTDNEAMPELRSLFSLSDLDLPGLSGNSLFKAEQKVAGIHTPYFYFASPASVFAMHMEDYAALSINYHHWGAPKRWVICCPADSEKLENLVVGMLGLKSVGCDQFVRHASVFVPTWVLERAGIRFTKVLQEEGDMIITFPWAYHEGWNQGLNVAEAIGYGDVGWERWVRGYRVCGKRCPLKPIEMKFLGEGFGEGSEVEDEEEENRREEDDSSRGHREHGGEEPDGDDGRDQRHHGDEEREASAVGVIQPSGDKGQEEKMERGGLLPKTPPSQSSSSEDISGIDVDMEMQEA